MNHLRARLRAKFGVPVLTATALACVVSVPWSDTSAQTGSGYAIGWHATASGGVIRARNSCYHLSGTIGQAVVTPGISMGTTYTLYSGFWTAAPLAGQDEIFFNGFEDCKQ